MILILIYLSVSDGGRRMPMLLLPGCGSSLRMSFAFQLIHTRIDLTRLLCGTKASCMRTSNRELSALVRGFSSNAYA